MLRIRSTLLLNTLKLSSSNVLLYALPFVVTPILSRLYLPEFFGEWGVFASTFTIVSVAMFGSYDNAIVKAHKKEVPYLIIICYAIGIATILISFIVFNIGNKLGVHFFMEFPYPILLYSYLFLHILVTVWQNVLNKLGEYNKLSINNFLIGGGQAVLRISWGFFVKIYNGLIIGTVLAQVLSVLYLKRITSSRCFSVQQIRYKSIIRIAKKYRKFPYFDAPALLLHFAAINLPVIILSFYFSRSDIGCYSLIIQLLVLPISFIGSAMGKVYYQEVSLAQINNNESQIYLKTKEVLRYLSYIAILPALFIGIGGDKLIVWFLGPEWHTAGNIALCLAIWSIPTILTEPLKPIFRVREKQINLLIIELCYFIISISLLICGSIMNMNLYAILLAYALCCTLIKIILFRQICILTKITKSPLPFFSNILIVMTVITLAFRYMHDIW